MPDRTIRTRLVQMEVRPGAPWDNAERMLGHAAEARRDGIELLVFPEMAVPGYLIGDEWEHHAFLRECEACGHALRAASEGLALVFGNVGVDWERCNEDGRVRKYNALFVAEDGVFVPPAGGPYPFAIKTLLPNYRQFDDSRHFFDLRKLAMERGQPLQDLITPIRTKRASLGCVLCEDAWDADYSVSPVELLAQAGAELFVNISSSPFTLNKNHKRNRVFTAQAERLGRAMVYVNNVGIQNNGKTVFTFDGSSCIYDGHGHVLLCGEPFAEAALTHDVPLVPGAEFGDPVRLQDDTIADAYEAIRYGTRKFMELCGVQRVTVGISGGIDSAVVAAIYRRILPPEDLLLVNMPGPFTSQTTRDLAAALAANLGCLYAVLPIADSVAVTRAQLDDLEILSADGRRRHVLRLSGPVLENIQARDRSSRVLAAAAAAFGSVFTCNANKSEATVGYTTLYGDLAGYLANLADLWKMEVYELARYLNREVYGAEAIPAGCLAIAPSAELSAAQNVDEGKGDPLVYRYHDRLFRSWVEWWDRTTPEDILAWYRDGRLAERLELATDISEVFPDAAAFVSDLERWWNLYQGMGLAKRIQAPPVMAVKRRAFGFDHRESQMGARYTKRYGELKAEILAG